MGDAPHVQAQYDPEEARKPDISVPELAGVLPPTAVRHRRGCVK
jgi:hypothetical protein